MKKILWLLTLLFVLPITAFSQQSFLVKNIQINGLKNIDPVTVESYLPIKRGQTLQPSKTAAILKSLYKTNFFEHISIDQRGNTLVITVVERPTIGSLKISGNSLISTDKLTNAIKAMDIAEGRVYNPSIIERIQKSLLNQYYQMGHYNARVKITTKSMTRNRVAVTINISEGLTARIKAITIIGNKAFSDAALLKQLDLTTSGLFTFFSQTDRFSEAKLASSIENLRNYYLDHGYLKVQIKSSQAQVTPDRKFIYLTIIIDEGQVYKIAQVGLSGQTILPKADLKKLLQIKTDDTFSRQAIINSEKAISQALGDKGYMFANVSVQPTINDTKQSVSLVFLINPGKRTYIRYITFTDNNHTNDVALRREVEQMEAAPVSTIKLENSKHQLSLLPYIKDVAMSVARVPDADDQVDLNYKVVENSAAEASFKVGYSTYGLLLAAGWNQKNFLGTGNTFGINFQRNRFEQFYSVDYTNPYYTDDGISRSLSFVISRTEPGNNQGVSSSYTTNEYDLGMVYGIPIGQEQGVYNRIIAGAIYQNTLINLQNDVSNQVLTFVNQHGRHFQELDLRLGYSRDSRDRAIFPTVGTINSFFVDAYAPLDRHSLTFYMLNYHGKWYQPIIGDFIALSRADFGYGNGLHGIDDFPFFRNYFAGGIDSVRGYQAFTLGPQDSTGGLSSAGKSIGGNMLVDASIGVIFPNHISENIRTSLFLDAGNVYATGNNRRFGGSSTNSGPIRLSYGLELDWLTPFGPIELVLARPINDRKGDDLRTFDFAIGANF